MCARSSNVYFNITPMSLLGRELDATGVDDRGAGVAEDRVYGVKLQLNASSSESLGD